MKDNGRMIYLKDKEKNNGREFHNTLVIFQMERKMVKEYTKNIDSIHMKVNFTITNLRGKEEFNIKTNKLIKGNG